MTDRAAPQSVEELEDRLSTPPSDLVKSWQDLRGDILLLGVGGKMGPTMARMALRASEASGGGRRVIGVSRFSSPGVREKLEGWGVETIACDLLDESAVAKLPDARHVIFMSGFKFGASSDPPRTWAMNCYAPAVVSKRFADSRIVAFSTGNVYPLSPCDSGGSRETDEPAPIGEYAVTALGRERIFQFFARELGFPLTLLRLNYATELRYGVQVDIGQQVLHERPVALDATCVNLIWLGDANAMTLRALVLDHDDQRVLNLAGPDALRVGDLAESLGKRLHKTPRFTGTEARDALLSNGHDAYAVLGKPELPIDHLLDWTADWLARGGELLDKPTHFEVRDGRF